MISSEKSTKTLAIEKNKALVIGLNDDRIGEREFGFAGIINTGNACYMSSVIHLWVLSLGNKIFENYLDWKSACGDYLNRYGHQDIDSFDFQLFRLMGALSFPSHISVDQWAKCYSERVQSLGSDSVAKYDPNFEYGSVNPQKFKTAWGKICPAFANSEQQDAGEFLCKFRQHLKDITPRFLQKKILSQNITVEVKSTLNSDTSSHEELILSLTAPLPGISATFQDMYTKWTTETHKLESGNSFTLIKTITEVADVLWVQIERWTQESNSSPTKNCTPIEEMDTDINVLGKTFTLQGVVLHIGEDLHSGHYIAYIRHLSSWLVCNDSNVHLTDQPKLNLGSIYVYRRAF